MDNLSEEKVIVLFAKLLEKDTLFSSWSLKETLLNALNMFLRSDSLSPLSTW